MADFTKNIPELSPAEITGYNAKINPLNDLGGPLLGDELFPAEDVDSLKYEYLKGPGNAVVMASFAAHGSEAVIISRKPIDEVKGEIPAIRVKIAKFEKEILNILTAQKSSDLRRKTAITAIYNDVDRTRRGVTARLEWFRMQMIAIGSVTLTGEIVQTIDFGIPATHKKTLAGTNKWSDINNSDPLTNIQDWIEIYVATNGFRPERAITSSKVVNYLLRNPGIRKSIFGDNAGQRAVSINQLNELMDTLNYPRIAAYDKQAQVQNEDGTFTNTRFYPQDRYTMLPPSSVEVGKTLRAPNAEALIASEAGVEVQAANGIYVTVEGFTDPPTIWTRASGNLFATLEGADAIFTADVY